MTNRINEILISASVLSAYWEYGKKDMLDLLMPFLKYTIAKNTKENEVVDVRVITEQFKSEFGFFDIPVDVVKTLLNRLSPKVLKISNREYTLIKSLDKEYDDYYNRLVQKKERQEKVCEDLANYLNVNIQKGEYNKNNVLNLLFHFFQRNGFFIVKKADQLNSIYAKDGRLNYEIARFVLKQYTDKTATFDYLVEMVTGYFISTAISYQNPSNSNITRFRKMHCYLDTGIIINALGLSRQEVTQSTNEFINMLKTSGAELFCFSHNYTEVRNIIWAYKNCLTNPKFKSYNTLEYFDEKHFSPDDVDNYLALLDRNIEKLGIRIVDPPDLVFSSEIESEFDYSDLVSVLKEKMVYNKKSIDKAADFDGKSIASIVSLRNGDRPTEFEKAKFIFVSTSYNLAPIVNQFMGYDKKRIVPVVISEMDLSSWLWIRNYNSYKDFPKSQLLLNSLLATEMPPMQFLDSFFDKLDKLQESGMLSIEEAATLRSDMFCRKEIYQNSYGDVDELSDKSIIIVREKLKEKYISETQSELISVNEELKRVKDKNIKYIENAYVLISEAGEKSYNNTVKTCKIIAISIMVLILLAVIFLFFVNFNIPKSYQKLQKISSIVIAVIDIIGIIQIVYSAKGIINGLIRKIALMRKYTAEDKKRAEFSMYFDNDDNS